MSAFFVGSALLFCGSTVRSYTLNSHQCWYPCSILFPLSSFQPVGRRCQCIAARLRVQKFPLRQSHPGLGGRPTHVPEYFSRLIIPDHFQFLAGSAAAAPSGTNAAGGHHCVVCSFAVFTFDSPACYLTHLPTKCLTSLFQCFTASVWAVEILATDIESCNWNNLLKSIDINLPWARIWCLMPQVTE